MLGKESLVGLVGALTATTLVLINAAETAATPPTGVNKCEDDMCLGAAWLARCLADDLYLYEETRLRWRAFEQLVEHCRPHVRDGRTIEVEEKVLTFLYVCAQGAGWREAKHRCGHSLSTITANFHEVLTAVLRLYLEVVQLPSGDVPEAIRDDPKRMPFFKDCVGALDGSNFKVYVPAEDQKRYRNRHGYLSQNVLAAVDFNMNFVYVLAGWEGSAHDSRVLKDARRRGFTAPPGKYYLADAGYTNSDITLVPYRGVRYHLREMAQVPDGRPQTPEELFNYRHSSLRNIVERCFGVFKRRWRVFDRPHEFDVETQVKLVYALAAVHNLINKEGSVGEDFDTLPAYAHERHENFFREVAVAEDQQPTENPDRAPLREAIATEMWASYRRAIQESEV